MVRRMQNTITADFVFEARKDFIYNSIASLQRYCDKADIEFRHYVRKVGMFRYELRGTLTGPENHVKHAVRQLREQLGDREVA